MEKNPHSGRRQRLMDQAMSEGLEGFYPHQVLELILYYAIPRQDTGAIGHRLIERFGSLEAVFSADREALMQVSGVGERAADWLARMGAMTRAYADLRQSDKPGIRSVTEAIRFLTRAGEALTPPATMQLLLTPGGRIQMFSRLADTTAWALPERLRTGLNDVLAVHARNVIVAMYPDGAFEEFSLRDREGAAQYARVLKAMGVTLMDVIAVTDTRALSLRRLGGLLQEEQGPSRGNLLESYE